MKVKVIALSVAAILGAAGTLHAASSSQSNDINQLQAPNINFEQIKQLTKQLEQRNTTAIASHKDVNTQINRQHSKFNAEGLTGEHVYIVRLQDSSVAVAARQTGSPIAASLQNINTQKVYSRGDATTRAVTTYRNQLLQKQRNVINEVAMATGQSKVRKQFTNALNGFSIKLTEEQANQIASLGSVASVMRSKHYDLLSDEGPKHIGADQVWNGTASPQGIAGQGEGQIIGIIDTGINSDHPSFADIGGDGFDHTNPWGNGNYVGDCVEEPEHIQCNDKLIGVRSYDVITDTYSEMIPGWPAIGEDYQGHGTHTAGTAAGNILYDVPYMTSGFAEQSDGIILKEDLFPQVSGVAPHANIIAYQVCHSTNDSGYTGCPGEALVAGIEDAITDGVDVINFSIGGADSNVWADPVQLAFLSAREAGISVAAAAGNSGTGECGEECFGYLDNSSPWLTQVAATTHGRTVSIETPIEYAGFNDPAMGSEVPDWSETGLTGGAINNQEITGVVVWSKDYEDVDGLTDRNGYCSAQYPAGTFDFYKDGTAIPGAAEGDTNVIVICQRHDDTDPNANARTAKIDNIKAGGADGFIMFNYNRVQPTVAQSYSLPGVHFTYNQFNGVYPAQGLEDWVDSSSELGHMITIGKTVIERQVNPDDADWLADFSSRGPSYDNVEVLAPTLAAPGVDIYAAYSDEHPFTTPHGADYAALSGTSMASPHVAGSMALLRQLHPTWSPAEVQSALSMTADNVVQYRYLNRANSEAGDAEIYRAGTGRINVANAAKAGLVMDETADNFLAADPYNGGTPHKLNLPNLVDFSCAPECQWVRTVKATRDGTWSVAHGDVINWNFNMSQQSAQNGVNIEVTPNNFSLKAGETQTIIVKASIMDTQDLFSNSEVELHSNLIFTAQEQDIPEAHWPVAFKYDGGELPPKLQTTAHTDQGTYVAKGITLPNTPTPVGRAYKPVKADIKAVTLLKDDEKIFPWATHRTEEVDPQDIFDESTFSEMISVPDNAKRLIVETLGVAESPLMGDLKLGNPVIYVGKDYNEDGVIQPQDEILCASTHAIIENFCNINNPEAGEYWYILYSPQEFGHDNLAETFNYAAAVVTGDVADNMQVSLPASDGANVVDMTVNWDMPMTKDDIYYTSIDVGTSNNNPNNIGNIAFKLTRGEDLVHLDVPKTGAKINEQIPYTFEILANQTGMDREFTISASIPEGLQIDPSNVLTSGQAELDISVTNGELLISGVQKDTSTVVADYIVTDNITDAMCKLPDLGNSNPGGYIDLAEFGINPSMSGFDESNMVMYQKGWAIPYANFYNGAFTDFSLYNNVNEKNQYTGLMTVRGNGFIAFNNISSLPTFHRKYKYESAPYESVSPLWRGIVFGQTPEMMSLGLSANEGISLASTQSGWGVVEWDNASDYANPTLNRDTGLYEWTERDSSFDFEVVFNAQTRHGKNEHELYFAYDNIDFADTDSRGSIGFQGYKGATYERGPLMGYKGQSIAFDNTQDIVKDDYIVCMDYTGPEASYIEVTAWAEVMNTAAGKTLAFKGSTSMQGTQDMPFSHSLSVTSHITVVPLSDMSTLEETPVSFNVSHIDEQNSANKILVSGEGITASVNGDEVTVTPNDNFSGVTEVTVTVADIENPSDAASTSFLLTVENIDDAPTAVVATPEIVITEGELVTLDASQSLDVDGDELTFTWSGNGQIDDSTAAITTVSGLAAGDHTFTVMVSDGTNTSEATMQVKVVTSQASLAIADIDHNQIDEDSSAEITVNFDNLLGQETIISAMASNADIQVNGHETGSTLTLTPTENFNGDIEVTVMVAFKNDPTAVAKTNFTLTVNAINDAPEVTLAETHIFVREDQVPTLAVTATDLDGDELSYQWAGSGTLATPNAASTQISDLVAGEYVYTVTVSDGSTSVEKAMQVSVTKAPEVVEPEDNDDSGGSLTWLTLIMAGFAGLRRRTVKRN